MSPFSPALEEGGSENDHHLEEVPLALGVPGGKDIGILVIVAASGGSASSACHQSYLGRKKKTQESAEQSTGCHPCPALGRGGRCVREVRLLPALSLATSQKVIVLRSQSQIIGESLGSGSAGTRAELSALEEGEGKPGHVISGPVLTHVLNTGEIYQGKTKPASPGHSIPEPASCEQWTFCQATSPFGGRAWRAEIQRVTWGPELQQLEEILCYLQRENAHTCPSPLNKIMSGLTTSQTFSKGGLGFTGQGSL